jgi:hypothetical protein
MDIITATNMAIVNKNLGHRTTTIRSLGHGCTGCVITVNAVFGKFYALTFEQVLSANTKGTGRPGINFNFGRHEFDSWLKVIKDRTVE